MKKRKEETYSAASVTIGVAARLVVALSADVTTDDDVKVESGGRGGRVVEDGEVGHALGVLADTDVDGGPVTGAVGVGAGVPDTGVLQRYALGVDVVLESGGRALPDVVDAGLNVGEGVGVAGLGPQRENHGLGTGVVGTADSGTVRAKVVDNVDTTAARLAKSAVLGTSKLELSVAVAVQSTNGLAGRALGGRPLGLYVAVRAGVRAERSLSTRVTANTSNNVRDDAVEAEVEARNLLDGGPAGSAKPVNSDGTVVGGESAAVKLSIGEVGSDTSGSRAAGGLGGGGSGIGRGVSRGSRGRGRGRRRGRGAGSAGGGGSLLEELSVDLEGARNNLGDVSGSGLANNDVETVLNSSLGLISANLLVAEDVGGHGGRDDGGDNIGIALLDRRTLLVVEVTVSVVVGLSSNERRREGEVHDGGLHFVVVL